MRLDNYLNGEWNPGVGEGLPLRDPVLGTDLARVFTDGVDIAKALSYARAVGGPALRKLSYAERAGLLSKIADTLSANRAAYFEIALANSGSPEADAAIDIDGAIYTLKYYARIGAALGDARHIADGDATRLGRDDSFQDAHVGVARRGVVVLINAFNFPAWGLWEKAAPALLSGVPVLAKPATATCWLTQRMVQDVVANAMLPEGALSLLCGAPRDLLDHVGGWDLVSFTGSAHTGMKIRSHPSVIRHSPRVNIEADSLNCAMLGPDASPGTAEFDLLVKEVAREMTQKAGQKCTAIRRVLVPRALRNEAG